MAIKGVVLAAGMLIAALLAGCGSGYPLGMSEQQWQRLGPEQQNTAIRQQAAYDREATAEQARARERQRLREEEAERRIDAAYANARHGDIVECLLEGGIADFHPGWRSFESKGFALVRGEKKQVTLRRVSGSRTTRFWAALQEEDGELLICRTEPSRYSSRDCAKVVALTRDFRRGLSRTINVEGILKRTTLRCGLAGGSARHRRYD